MIKGKLLIPGTAFVRQHHFVPPDREWYCAAHQTYIKPVYIRDGRDVEAACEACILEDLAMKIGDVEFAIPEDATYVPPPEPELEIHTEPPLPEGFLTIKVEDLDEDNDYALPPYKRDNLPIDFALAG